VKFAELRKSLSNAIQASSHVWIEIPHSEPTWTKFLNIFTGSIIIVITDKDNNVTSVESEK